jgi:hypothetical protein
MDDGAKPRDLEDRTFEFAQSARPFVKQLPRTVSNTEDVRQLVRPSGSVAAKSHHLEERVIAQISFWNLAIELSLGFGNWDLEP